VITSRGEAPVVPSAWLHDVRTTTSAVTRKELRTSPNSFGRHLDDNVCCFDRCDRRRTRSESQFVGCLSAHKCDHAMRTGLDIDLRHNPVLDDVCHYAGETVTRGLSHEGLGLGLVDQINGEAGKFAPVDDAMPAGRPPRAQSSGVGPAPEGFGADSEQGRRPAHSVLGHGRMLAHNPPVVRFFSPLAIYWPPHRGSYKLIIDRLRGRRLKGDEGPAIKRKDGYMTLSARNQVTGRVTKLTLGTVMAEAAVAVGGQEIVAAITRESAERLGLSEGSDVTVVIKATDVMLAT
jgi:molybdopterin-binding protein